MSDSTENPKQFRLQDGDAFGFSDDGERVPIVRPADDDGDGDGETPGTDRRGIDVEQLIDALLSGNADATRIGERAVLLAYLMPRCTYRPRSLRELGARLGCSHVAARDKLNRVKAEFVKELDGF
jgi:hypothetical protein